MKNEANDLKERIRLLENSQIQELTLLISQIQYTFEEISQIPSLKNSIQMLRLPPIIKDNIFNLALSVSTDYISRKILVNSSNSPTSKTIGFILDYAFRVCVFKNTEKIKAIGEVLFYKLSDRVLKSN